ncbi:MAG: choice-of-anchor Q domain-containing protein [Verrucomicrobiota bacterium]
MTLNNSTIAGCLGNYGGGIFNGAALTVNNSTITGCSANYEGGAIASSSFCTVNDSTFTGCSAPFYQSAGISTWGGMSLNNSIVAGNAPGNIFGGYGGTNNITSGDPQLAPLGNYGGPTPTMPPLPGSPAVDAGNDSATNTVATDQRGYSRKLARMWTSARWNSRPHCWWSRRMPTPALPASLATS